MAERTPLFSEHVKLGARMVEFAGWEMPVFYKGLAEEHKCVRSAVGLFDVSHMGEIWFEGPQALASLQWMTCNDLSGLQAGQAQYSLLLNEKGGIVDDIIVYCVKPGAKYMVCVNAANIEKDEKHMRAQNRGALIQNESPSWGQIAVQGPKAISLLKSWLGGQFVDQKAFSFHWVEYKGAEILVARTGYTGEDGVELFIPRGEQGGVDRVVHVWRDLLNLGVSEGVEPIGLGARDTLRTEMKYSLYGHEITDDTNPFEARLGWVVKIDKGDFYGKSSLLELRSRGLTRELVGFTVVEKGIPREGYSLISFDNFRIGTVTSGTLSPSLGMPIGIGYVSRDFAKEGTEFYVEIRGRQVKARVVKTPFVSAGLSRAKSK